MFRVFSTATRKPVRGFASALALAVTLAGGGFAATTVPAAAQDKPAKPQYTDAFVKAYQPTNEALNAAADKAAADPLRGQVEALVPLAQTVWDKDAAGSLLIMLGSKVSDPVLQRRGLEMRLASGLVPAAQTGLFNFFVGQLYFQEQNYGAARPALERALAAGYTENNPEGMLIESYFRDQQAAQGLQYLKGVMAKRDAAGQAIEENWLRRALGVAYESRMTDEAVEWAGELVARYPNTKNWRDAVRVINTSYSFSAEERLDLLRLMLATNSFDAGGDVLNYIEAADPRRMPNEVVRLVDHAVGENLVAMSDPYVKESYDLAKGRANADRTETAGLIGEARSSANPRVALGVGDSFMSFEDYANAEAMFTVALEKPGVDRDRALTRLGIAQAMQGKAAEAKATLEQVSGNRAPIARLWTSYAASKALGG